MKKAKEFLNEIKKLNTLIENKRIEREQWRDIALSVTGRMEGERVQSSGNQQKMETSVINGVEIEREIEESIVRYQRRKQEIIKVIEQFPVIQYDVLHRLYIQGFSLQEVADAKKCTYSNITTIHGQALAGVQRILDAED